MIRQRTGGAIRRANTSSSSIRSSTRSSTGGLSRLYLLHSSRDSAMHFTYGGSKGRSIFTTAAALASAYYVGGLGA